MNVPDSDGSSSSSDADLIANGFRQARDADTMDVLNAFSSKSKVDSLVFYVVSTRWMAKIWPVLSGGSAPPPVIEDDRNNNIMSAAGGSGINNNNDWRVNLGRIENAHLLEGGGGQQSVSSSSAVNATISNSSEDEEENAEGKNQQRPLASANNNNNDGSMDDGSSGSTNSPARNRMMHELHMVQQRRKQSQNDSQSHGRLREDASPDVDYVLMGPNAWFLLREKFGYDVEIPRRAVAANNNSNNPGEEESPLAVEVQPAEGSSAAVRVPVPPAGHFRYEAVFQRQQAFLLSDAAAAAAAASAASEHKIAPPADDNAPDRQLNNKDGASKTEETHRGNVSDDDTADEYDLLPQLEDDDRMSMDHQHDNARHQEHNDQPILLLPASTTASAPSSPGASYAAAGATSSSSPYHRNHNHNPQHEPLSPSTPTTTSSSWLNSVNNYGNGGGDDNKEIVMAPAPLRYPYGSGLGNLGNTCFMNSILQCLAHTDPLRKYFLSGEYERDLNRGNPLGTGGDLAVQFAALLGEIWGTTDTRTTTAFGNAYQSSNIGATVYPRNFKYTLGRHAEQFVGYDQHDSQELATYLLDALHEDTNRVTFKPYVEKPEQGVDETDEEASKKAWDLHLKREDSTVLEYFMGQVKSRVQCCKENCGRVSTTFDPTMYLSVPIPGSSEKSFLVTFVPLDPTMRPQDIPITISKTASMRDLRRKFVDQLKTFRIISESETIPPEDLCFCDIFQHKVYRWYKEKDSVDLISPNDKTVVYQLPPLAGIRKLEAEHAAAAAASGGGAEQSQQVEGMRERSPKRYKLKLEAVTRLNRGEAWMGELSWYLQNPSGITTAFNPIRGSRAERVMWYNRICAFIDLCSKEAEDSELAAGSKRMRDDDVSTSTDHVSFDECAVQSIDERCLSSRHFRNVSKRYDLAILEFCAKKMRAEILNMERQKKEVFPDGISIEIRIRKYLSYGLSSSKETPIAMPFVLRIPSNTTVYGLRQILSKCLSRVLRTGHEHYRQSLVSAAGESTAERPSAVIENDDSGDYSSSSLSAGCLSDPELLIIRQVSLAYEPECHLINKCMNGTQLGSLERTHGRDASRPAQLASPNDDEEKVLIAQVVGPRGTVFMDWCEDIADRFSDLEEYAKTVKHPNSGEEESLVSDSISVLDCIEKYCQKEQLEESEMWYCNKCKEHVQAWKQFHLYRSPPILIVHLKRFMFSASTHRRDKINTFIDFPLEGLDLTGQVMHWTEEQKPIYDCYAVSNHFGGLGGGHYTAYALTNNGAWCYYDDSRVTTNVDRKEVVSNAAYVLFYRRRDVPVGEEFVVNMQSTVAGVQTPAVIQDPLVRVGESSDDVSSSNAAMVDEDEHMDMDDTDLASRSTSPMGSMEGNGVQFDDSAFDPLDGKGDDLPLQ